MSWVKAVCLLILLSGSAYGQSQPTPPFQATAPLTAAQLNTAFAAKADYPYPSFAQTIASGSILLSTVAIPNGTCAAPQFAAATGTLATDVITTTFNADPTAAVGYRPTAMLTIIPYPAVDAIYVRVCNTTAASITPDPVTINWRVTR
jgi:hypothetical protein